MARLRYVNCASPGLSRRRCGRGFSYHRADGHRVADADVDRIRALVIPPAWQDVWICPWPNGHIQATGFDAKGRRQYLYHPAWRIRRDREKFDRMMTFARALPDLRAVVTEHLAAGALGQNQILACAAHLLDIGFFRIGTEGYAEENNTFGLATMLKSHVTISGDSVTFDYPAKGGKRRVQSVVDPTVSEIVAQLKRRRGGGPELLAYRAPASAGTRGARRWVDVTSDDINAYLRAGAGIACSAKDFRTWNATVLAAVALAVGEAPTSDRGRKRRVAQSIDEVAHYLGNTPAVARASYVDSRIIDLYLAGETISIPPSQFGHPECSGGLCIQGPIERAVIDLLDGCVRQVAVAA
jgi:DNA topoisomerase-1